LAKVKPFLSLSYFPKTFASLLIHYPALNRVRYAVEMVITKDIVLGDAMELILEVAKG